ncbi:MAG: hypothetical protein J6C07_08365 [Lachnospiraceae bacterium]|nr:hypothetical protein [Lachnospiraceae bacterium]
MTCKITLLSSGENSFIEVELPVIDWEAATGLPLEELETYRLIDIEASNCFHDWDYEHISIDELNSAVREFNSYLPEEQELILDIYYCSVNRDLDDFILAINTHSLYEVFVNPQYRRTRILAGISLLKSISFELAEEATDRKGLLPDEAALTLFYLGIQSDSIIYVDRNGRNLLLVKSEDLISLPTKRTYDFLERFDKNFGWGC